jgi:GNAT superfamily N-acetyltransferase
VGDVTANRDAKRQRLSAPVHLSADHRLDDFDCGAPALNRWIREQAGVSEGRTARTYVVCEGHDVVGYYCIASGSVERGTMPSKIKRARGMPNHVPVAIIGRLARDLRYRGTGLGQDLLRDALLRIIDASETIGVRAILVHAIDDAAAKFWTDAEFEECPVGSRTFFMPIETAIDALS